MRYIALFFPAILSMGIAYKQNKGEIWKWFDYLYRYAIFVICNVFLTESVVSYVFRKDSVTIEAFNSFSFFTKYIFAASVFAIILPHAYKIVKDNVSVSFEVHKVVDGSIDCEKSN